MELQAWEGLSDQSVHCHKVQEDTEIRFWSLHTQEVCVPLLCIFAASSTEGSTSGPRSHQANMVPLCCNPKLPFKSLKQTG